MRLPNLIPDWKRAWRFLSVQAALLLALLSGLQAEVLPLVSPLFPAPVWPWVSGGLALVVVLLRLVAQPGLVPDSHRAMLERFYEDTETFRRDSRAHDRTTYGPWGLGGGGSSNHHHLDSGGSDSGSSSDSGGGSD